MIRNLCARSRQLPAHILVQARHLLLPLSLVRTHKHAHVFLRIDWLLPECLHDCGSVRVVPSREKRDETSKLGVARCAAVRVQETQEVCNIQIAIHDPYS